ncbi:MAG TPA: DUF6491 family protein [Allosphingosinicella sp.]|nr:DUF6491 family protein [Allosphingosinicella sp.]
MAGRLAAALTLFGLTASCAVPADTVLSAADAEARQCFHAGQVNSFNPVDDNAVNVRVGVNDYYRLEIIGFCPDIDWATRVALRTRGGSSWVCRGLDAEIIVPGPTSGGTQSCLVQSMRKLSDAEVAALRNK